jgi:hypothetical protein
MRSMATPVQGRRIWVAAAMLLAPPALFAQWPAHPTPDVPKTPDGKPDLNAPAPRTADGKPDFSGIWKFVDSPEARPGPAPPPAVKASGLGARIPGLYQFFDIGSTLKEGLPFQPWAAALRKQRVERGNKDNPDAHCLPIGLGQLDTHPEPRKIVQTPNLIVMVYEANGGLRQIFMDGRPLPGEDAQPWWYGYSTGKWDGDTLVVQTNGFRDDGWLDVEGSPLTEAARVTERFRRVNFGTMEIELTVDDPKAYTRPWTVKVTHHIMLNTDLIEFICQENEKDAPHMMGR